MRVWRYFQKQSALSLYVPHRGELCDLEDLRLDAGPASSLGVMDVSGAGREGSGRTVGEPSVLTGPALCEAVSQSPPEP